MRLSNIGVKMASPSGLRAIMEDIADTMNSAPGRRWLNLGIGNPAFIPEVASLWQGTSSESLASSFAEVSCRYGPSRGLPKLVDAIVKYFSERYGWSLGAENVVVGPGSQMLCFIAAALFAGLGADGSTNILLPITPDYTGYQGLCMVSGGIVGIDPILCLGRDRSFSYQLDMATVRAQANVGLLLVSSPSNPAGRCLQPDELAALVEIATEREVPLLIDNAYGDPFPRVVGSATPPVWSKHVINCFSASKAGLPGERLGFAIGDPEYIEPMVAFLANSVLHAPSMAQAALSRALASGALDSVTASVITPFYEQRRKQAEELLRQVLPADVAWRIHTGCGGMFVWICIDEDWFDDCIFYELLKRQGVFVVPGRYFFTENVINGLLSRHARQCVRISITQDPEDLAAGFEIITRTLVEMRAQAARVSLIQGEEADNVEIA